MFIVFETVKIPRFYCKIQKSFQILCVDTHTHPSTLLLKKIILVVSCIPFFCIAYIKCMNLQCID